jgi:hypothetical protein
MWEFLDCQSPRRINIHVEPEEVKGFFGQLELPEPSVTDVMLTKEADMDVCEEDDFFLHLEDAFESISKTDSFVNDFVVFLLRLLRYDHSPHGRWVIHSHKDIKLEMYTEKVQVRTDAIITQRLGLGVRYNLIVQEDKVKFSALPLQ